MNRIALTVVFASTIFLSAFLLFLVQPLVSKNLLPWFGGSASVWATCMVFFQVLLLAGYAYADVISKHLKVKNQVILHLALYAFCLLSFSVLADKENINLESENPTLTIVMVLLGTIGLAYFLLSSTGPLMQKWLTKSNLNLNVYRFFSLSNLASLAALVSYPFLIEPYFSLTTQAQAWKFFFFIFSASITITGVAFLLTHDNSSQIMQDAQPVEKNRPGIQQLMKWIGLSALGSWMLISVTNHITHDIAAIPMLWIAPLSIYLISFVLCFENDRWYSNKIFFPMVIAAVAIFSLDMGDWGFSNSVNGIPLYIGFLFIICMFAHGELASSRPSSEHLTRFYLMTSVGGALGGLLVGFGAPFILPAYYELGIGFLAASWILYFLSIDSIRRKIASLILIIWTSFFLHQQINSSFEKSLSVSRNFYGTLKVVDEADESDKIKSRRLYDGNVNHGEQYLDADRRMLPTTYFGPDSGVGLLLGKAEQSLKVGIIGLGAGVLATYGKPNDEFIFYEINPEVVRIAQKSFTFLKDAKSDIKIKIGDGRLLLEREPSNQFDIIILDAFSGGAVPTHLLTKEAYQIYLNHLKPNGVLAFNSTNHRINVPPLIKAVADDLNLTSTLIVHRVPRTEMSNLRSTKWSLVSRDPNAFRENYFKTNASDFEIIQGLEAWRDDFNNIFKIIKFTD